MPIGAHGAPYDRLCSPDRAQRNPGPYLNEIPRIALRFIRATISSFRTERSGDPESSVNSHYFSGLFLVDFLRFGCRWFPGSSLLPVGICRRCTACRCRLWCCSCRPWACWCRLIRITRLSLDGCRPLLGRLISGRSRLCGRAWFHGFLVSRIALLWLP